MLDPTAQGTGGASGSYGYIENQGIVIGIEPGTGTEDDLRVTTNYVEVSGYSETRSSSTFNFTISQVTRFVNTMNHPISFDFGWGVYDSTGRLIQKLSTSYVTSMAPQYFVAPDQTLMFGAGRSSGVYRIVPIYSERNANNWRPCEGAGVNHIRMVIQSNKCTVTAQGTGGIPNYQVNSIDVTGNMHPNRPIDIKLNLTNTGNSRNDFIYMYSNGSFIAEGFVDIDKGMSGDVHFEYSRPRAGTYELTFYQDMLKENLIGSKTVTIDPMPAAQLSGTATVLNVVDPVHRIIQDDKFRVKVNVTNDNSTAYQEDIAVDLYKRSGYSYTERQTKTQTISLNPGSSKTLQFDLDEVIDGWNYYAIVWYYSEGRSKPLAYTNDYSIYFSDPPVFERGDVNNDGEVNISDVNATIGVILGQITNPETVGLADVNAIIGIILRG